MTRLVEAEVQTMVNAPEEQAWRVFIPVDLTRLFKGKWPLPAVTQVSNQTGPWDVVGQTRKVSLSDGAELSEEVTGVEPPGPRGARFGYTVRGYSGFIGMLVKEGRGFWVFQDRGDKTAITWRYSFLPHNRLTQPLVILIVALFWRRYMQDALNVTVDLIEADRRAA